MHTGEARHKDEEDLDSLCVRAGNLADDDPVCVLLYRSCPYDRGEGLGDQRIECIFLNHSGALSDEVGEADVQEDCGMSGRICGDHYHQSGTGGVEQRFYIPGMVLVCAFSYGFSSVTLKMISDREKPVTITAYQLLFGGAVLILIGAVSGGAVHGFNVRSSLLLLYMSLLSTAAFCIWAELLKYNSVGKVAIFGFSIPVFGVALSAVFLGEQVVSVKNLAALVCVSIGIIIINRKEHGI